MNHKAIAISALVASACSFGPATDETTGQQEDPILPLYANPLAGRPMSGIWTKTSGDDADPAVCRECSYTSSADAPPGAQYAARLGSAEETSWRNQFPNLGGTPGMRDALAGATTLAQAHLTGSFNTDLDKALCHTWVLLAAASNLLGGDLQPSISSMSSTVQDLVNSTSFAAALVCENTSVRNQIVTNINTVAPSGWAHFFPPEYARHLRSEYKPNGLSYTNHQYAEPACLAEMDGRAARSYCGMRRAAQVADGRKLDLGSEKLASFLFWDVGEVGGSVRFLPPQRVAASNSEAFVMPLVVSGAVNPLSGPVLPHFSDLTHPLVWVSADSQYESSEQLGQIGWTYSGTFPNLRRTAVYGAQKRFDNMAHADYLAGTQREARVSLNDLTLFTLWGVIFAKLGVDLNFTLGKPVSGHQLGVGAAASRSVNLDSLMGSIYASDGRISEFTSAAGYSSLAVEGPAGFYPGYINTGSQFGTLVRYRQQDDRAVVVRDRIAESLELTAEGGLDVGPVNVTLTLDSSITSAAQLDTVFREHLSVMNQGATTPTAGQAATLGLQSNAVVSVERKSEVTAVPLTATLDFSAHFCIFGCFDVDWSKTLYTTGTAGLGGKTSRSNEPDKLRVGLFGQTGLTAYHRDGQRPSVFSHLPKEGQPNGEQFTSFPQTVGECLAQDPEIQQPVPTEMPTPGGSVEPGICLVTYGTFSPPGGGSVGLPKRIPSGVCDGSNRVGFTNEYMATCTGSSCAEERQCITDFVNFNCAEGGDVDWDGVLVHSREVDAGEAPSFLSQLHECAELHGRRGANQAEANALVREFQQLFSVALCEDGVPLGDRHF